ncbi:MAG: hypothetical protein K2O18_01520, partial [Oscillospiraceae bacterium]|nr:hypothetical protein [Oscillospiraceae bacterium]
PVLLSFTLAHFSSIVYYYFWLDRTVGLMERTSPDLVEWDESIIRQLVDTVKVMSADTIIVYLQGGIEITQDITHE